MPSRQLCPQQKRSPATTGRLKALHFYSCLAARRYQDAQAFGHVAGRLAGLIWNKSKEFSEPMNFNAPIPSFCAIVLVALCPALARAADDMPIMPLSEIKAGHVGRVAHDGFRQPGGQFPDAGGGHCGKFHRPATTRHHLQGAGCHEQVHRPRGGHERQPRLH